MQVFVYPEIRCKELTIVAGDDIRKRWVLLPPTEELPPVTEFTGDPRPVVEHITTRLEDDEGIFRIRAALWKRHKDYFIIDDPENRPDDRYRPDMIRGYNLEDPVSVDAEHIGPGGDGKKVYCGPNNENEIDPEVDCAARLPQHGTERIDVIQLSPPDPERAGQEISSLISTKGGME